MVQDARQRAVQLCHQACAEYAKLNPSEPQTEAALRDALGTLLTALAAADGLQVLVEGREKGKTCPSRAFGSNFWPDIVMKSEKSGAERWEVPIELKLVKRGEAPSACLATVIGQAAIHASRTGPSGKRTARAIAMVFDYGGPRDEVGNSPRDWKDGSQRDEAVATRRALIAALAALGVDLLYVDVLGPGIG
jgi:hypothetical protein